MGRVGRVVEEMASSQGIGATSVQRVTVSVGSRVGGKVRRMKALCGPRLTLWKRTRLSPTGQGRVACSPQ